jgi:hypothetical protein
MYLPGQIVYDLDKHMPVRVDDVWNPPKRTTHFIKAFVKYDGPGEQWGYELARPETIGEAILLLFKNIIVPAPVSPTHCWLCRNWIRNCNEFNTCQQSGKHEEE